MKIASGLAALSLLAVAACGSSDDKPYQPSQAVLDEELINFAETAVKDKLRDPDSAKFSDVNISTKGHRAVCGRVNSKNGFGGRSGAQRFISAGTDDSTFLEEGTPRDAMKESWARVC